MLNSPARRIVSLVPSQTELLHSIGLDAEVIGITKFCVHPNAWFHSKQRIGGTKDIKMDLIKSLDPDLVIANKEENVREQVTALWQDVPVYVSDVAGLDDALSMVADIGVLTGKEAAAQELSNNIKIGFQSLLPTAPVKVAYLIWRAPYMTIGGDTFIHQMLAHAGFEQVFANRRRYPVVSIDELRNSGCQLVLLSSEPYPFREKHMQELAELLPGIPSLLVDGELFSWFGSRLLHAPAYYARLREDAQQVLHL
ncbi:substrate-binding protein [Cnuella takakiae]|uniref:Substrate-binding protein n=1 Tax=Cnuella takakiae TaxID=1302690 RepID=A0A1M5HD14_9BACT|nr:helical backbone metal receptor [Cnuella takakiae]SHG13846.1 substrate-binding protein [Cnuella takakiae]